MSLHVQFTFILINEVAYGYGIYAGIMGWDN